jgi:hypothetical protein
MASKENLWEELFSERKTVVLMIGKKSSAEIPCIGKPFKTELIFKNQYDE